MAIRNGYFKGGDGCTEAAEAVIKACDQPNKFKLLYPDDMPIKQKIETVAREIYRADGVDYTPLAEQKIQVYTDLGWGNLSLNMAKTHLSLSHDPDWKGVPKNYRVPIRDIRASVGAGFLYPMLGEMRTMPGLRSQPAFWPVDIDEMGVTKGLF